MVINKTQRIIMQNEVRKIYEAYMTRKDSAERLIRERLEREILAEKGDALKELSKTLHEYHRKGLPKAALRVATKKYGNNEEFRKLWDAYEPEDTFALAVGRQSIPVFEWVDNVLYVHRNPETEEVLENPVAFPLYNRSTVYMGTYDLLDDYLDEALGRTVSIKITTAAGREVSRAFEEEEVTRTTHPFDYVNDLPENERDAFLRREDKKNFTSNAWITKEN